MSNDQRMKPPPLKLGDFKPPEGLVAPPRPSFYSEESTMITSLSDLEKGRIAQGTDLPKAPPNLPSISPPLSSSNGPPIDGLPNAEFEQNIDLPSMEVEDAFEGTAQLSPEELKALEEGGLFDVPNTDQADLSARTTQPTIKPMTDMVVVFNTRGGVGATTLAVNLAGSVQAFGQHVAIIDLDLQLGTVSSMLEGKPLERSLAEFVIEASESSTGQIKSAIDERNGIHIIAQEGRISEIGMVTPDRLPKFFDAIKSQHGMVIIDGVRSFSDQAVTALDRADVILLVITQDIPALRSARQVLSLFKRLGYDRGKVKIVINRYLPKNPLTISEIEDRLDHEVYESLDNHFPFVSSLIEQGRLARDVNLKHPVTQGFDRLACKLLGIEVKAKKRGLFSFLSKRRRP
jgi:pilus assembly protein CpaE